MYNIIDFFSGTIEKTKEPSTFEEKIRPQKLNDLSNLGNSMLIKEIKKFSFVENVFVTGPVGCGKTLAVKLILEDLKIKYICYDSSTLKKKQDFNLNGKILIDNLESLSDFMSVSDLPQKNMIFICNEEKIIRFKDLLQKCKVFTFKKPSVKQLQTYLLNVSQILDTPIETVLDIAKKTNGDIRLSLTSLEINLAVTKDIHMDIFDVFRMGIQKYACEEFYLHASDESLVISNILFENLCSLSSDIDTISDAYEALSSSESFIGLPYHFFISVVWSFSILKAKVPAKLNYGNVWSKISNSRIKQTKINNLLMFLTFRRCFLSQIELGCIKKILTKKQMKENEIDKNQINLLMSLM